MTPTQDSADLPDQGTTNAEMVVAPRGQGTERQLLTTRSRWRRWLTVVLVALTVLSVVASTVAIWMHETVFDTDRFMAIVDPVLDESALYELLSERVSDEIVVVLDTETRVAVVLTDLDEALAEMVIETVGVGERGQAILDRIDRPSLAVLAIPIADAVNTRIVEIVDGLIISDEFTTILPELVREAHAASVALLRGDLTELPNVYLEDGEVRLNLTPIIADALRLVVAELGDLLPDITLPEVISNEVVEGRQQIAAAVNAELPEDFGQVSLFSEEQLTYVQDIVKRLDRLVWLLALITIVVAAATVAFSPTRRRTTIQLALGIIGGLVVGVIAIRRLEAAILEELAGPNASGAGRSLLDQVIGSLRSVVLIIVLGAALVAIAAHASGRPTWLAKVSAAWKRATEPSPDGSDLDRWVSRHHDVLRLGGSAIAVVALFVWGLTLMSVIVVPGLLAAYLWAIANAQRRTPSMETPDEPATDVTPRSN